VHFTELAALVERWLGRFAGVLAILIVAQIQYAHSDAPASDASKVNNCVTDATLSNFKAGLEGFAKTVTGRTEIPDEFIRQYFAECAFEGAQALLVKSGFDTGELDPRSNNSEIKKGTRRLVLAEKIFDLSVFLLPPSTSIEVSARGTNNVNNCNASNSEFEADLKRLSDTINERKDIPREFLQRHFNVTDVAETFFAQPATRLAAFNPVFTLDNCRHEFFARNYRCREPRQSAMA
jgi:hypothetical protein